MPAGVVGYVVTVRVLSGLALPSGLYGFVLLVVPLFVGGLCIAACLLPTFDRMAKRDLAAHRAGQVAKPGGADDPAPND